MLEKPLYCVIKSIYQDASWTKSDLNFWGRVDETLFETQEWFYGLFSLYKYWSPIHKDNYLYRCLCLFFCSIHLFVCIVFYAELFYAFSKELSVEFIFTVLYNAQWTKWTKLNSLFLLVFEFLLFSEEKI